jgi:hypothetical protein
MFALCSRHSTRSLDVCRSVVSAIVVLAICATVVLCAEIHANRDVKLAAATAGKATFFEFEMRQDARDAIRLDLPQLQNVEPPVRLGAPSDRGGRRPLR